jgi:TPP-dependent pyruvate/acetoin dehydrogenase alpha subunit
MEEVLRNDPIKRFEAELVAQGIMTEDQPSAIWTEVEADLQAAITFTEESPYPPLEEALTDLMYQEVTA